MNWMFFSGLQVLNLVIVIGFVGLWIYVLILLINFLKLGTRAFQKYLDSDRD